MMIPSINQNILVLSEEGCVRVQSQLIGAVGYSRVLPKWFTFHDFVTGDFILE